MKTISKNETHQAKEKRQSREHKRRPIGTNQSSEMDVTERREINEILKDSKEIYLFLFNNSNDALFVSLRQTGGNLPGKFLLVNDTACQRLGYSHEELLQMGPLDISEHLPTLDDNMKKLAFDKHIIHEQIHITKDGRRIPVEISTRAFELNGIQVNLSIARDITERKQMEEKLKQLSIHDALTGLYNRGFFDEELTRIERGRQFPVSFAMADVDHLKEMNDHQGHAAGDAMLKRTVQVLTAAFRADDIVARIGGDEFAVILPNTDAMAAKNILLRVRHILEKHNDEQEDIPLIISFGVSTADKSMPLVDALKAADANMYREKRARNNS
ncbi:MAG: diguanylate cyclase [Chloroflexi bacterium]|nr:diguanylate cyclase [Chloroflexota bacterium]